MSTKTGEDDLAKAPQQLLDEFWEGLITKKPGKITNIFPPSLYANLLPPPSKIGTTKGKNTAESYQAAADQCRARVQRIVRECRRTNEKFTDPEFDIETDRMFDINNCLKGLKAWYDEASGDLSSVTPWQLSDALKVLADSEVLALPELQIDVNAAARVFDTDSGRGERGPKSVHRIDWIFDNPSFTVDGFSTSDVQQGANGDCWFIAAVASLCNNPSLMHRVCVEKDEECGVYGFVFNRDGEWTWTVVDDNLYLNDVDFDALGDQYDSSGIEERKYKKNNQTGSDALYFAKCADQNETWLPLLEKAYAKIHGDYASIAGGWSGEAIEDLTGGVTTKIMTSKILSKERLWKELLQVNKEFLFSASSPGSYGDDTTARQGLALQHAYSVIKAVEEEDEDGKKHRLVMIRNPWGRRSWNGVGEWNGAWSDGAKEWTPYWMNKLNYRFADDGVFWMSFDDVQKRFHTLDRTRLFDKEWTMVQHWTSASVAWVTGYLNTKFLVEIKKKGPTIFVLCQLDDRYFKGLEGKYYFDLHFILQEKGAAAGEHIVRARGAWFGNRSISAEINLEPGNYEVLPKIVASKNEAAPDVFDVVTKLADVNPQKLRQIGMNYDTANARGVVELTEEEKKRKEQKKKEAYDKKKKEKEDAEEEKTEFEAWKKERREREAKKGTETVKDEKKDAPVQSEKPATTQTADQKKEDTSSDLVEGSPKTEAPSTEKKETTEAEVNEKEKDGTSVSENSIPDNTTQVGATASTALSGDPEGDVADATPTPAPLPIPAPVTSKTNPWNAVCVLGLRVYSQDPDVSIKLIKPADPEEAAVLDADGATAAGATM